MLEQKNAFYASTLWAWRAAARSFLVALSVVKVFRFWRLVSKVLKCFLVAHIHVWKRENLLSLD
jgi:hypothetical protein